MEDQPKPTVTIKFFSDLAEAVEYANQLVLQRELAAMIYEVLTDGSISAN